MSEEQATNQNSKQKLENKITDEMAIEYASFLYNLYRNAKNQL